MSEQVSNNDFNTLAIVIPAYKPVFFYKTLNSLAAQTNKNFNVYIGDDDSPADLKSIVALFEDKLNIRYTRFPNNIGSKNIVLQWRRCIELTKNEDWLWLFSDDDLMDEDCVENFYATIEKKKDRFDAYRFNTITIDDNDKVTFNGVFGPEEESSAQMAYHLLKSERGNSMPDHIFSRRIYDRCGGFVYTDYAQGADWATSILFAQEKGISIVPRSKVYWRNGGSNISAEASYRKDDMIGGHLQFMKWAVTHFEYLKKASADISYAMIMDALRLNLRHVMIFHYRGFNNGLTFKLLKFYHKTLKISYIAAWKELFLMKEPFIPVVHKIYCKILTMTRR